MSSLVHGIRLGVAMSMLAAEVAWCSDSTVVLSSSTSHSLIGGDGNPLPEGALALVFGSFDATSDAPRSIEGAYVAASATGDDVFIGCAQVLSNGMLETAGLTYQAANVQYLYLRFFETAQYPVEGKCAWGVTEVRPSVFNSLVPYADIDFTPAENCGVAQTNVFVAIPSTGGSEAKGAGRSETSGNR